MSEQANNEGSAATQAAEDLNTTPPNPSQTAGNTGWTMPEPVFRKTSGYLPQGFEKKYSQEEGDETTADDRVTAVAPEPKPASVSDVQPQPKITDTYEVAVPTTDENSAEPKKGGRAKIIFTIIGLLLAVALVAAFIAVVYFLFLSPASDRTF